jgi:2-dehydro-3-deoxygalactonokinase
MAITLPANAILIDWGTTNARAYRRATDGMGVESRRLPRGIRQVAEGGFPAALAELLGPWSDGDASAVLMSGMIGSRQGWVEVPYCPCPVRLADLAARLMKVPGRPGVRIVPGVSRAEGGRHDVMRGEEVQVFGAVGDQGDAVLCLPGTHSKWVRCAEGRLADFATAMTGEVFDVLRRHSLLGALMTKEGDAPDEAADADGFRRGLDRSAEAGGLLNHLFGVRAEGLFAAIPPAGLSSYLSGMLIGHEIRAMADLFPGRAPIRLVADGALAERYAAALKHLHRPFETVDVETATLRGLTRLLEQAGPLA